MRVLKFGGTSVADADAIIAAAAIIKSSHDGEPLMVVCSAMSGITNLLTRMSKLASRGDQEYLVAYHAFRDRHTRVANELLDDASPAVAALEENYQVLRDLLRGIFLVREVSPRTLDYVLSFGERHSCYLITAALSDQGLNAGYVDARKLITTDKSFNNAIVDKDLSYNKIRSFYSETKYDINVVTGFIAADVGGLTTTIGRGGSDYTASLIAAALKADRVDIYTDVDGVLTTDPRKVDTAFTIPELSYAEAMEMSHFGAKVIYPPTIAPALEADVPIYIRNTFNPTFEGTYIGNRVKHYEHGPIKGLTALSDVAVLTVQGSGLMGVPGISAKLFTALAQSNINILLITQASSEYSITLALRQQDLKKAIVALSRTYEHDRTSGKIRLVIPEKRMSIIAVVGEQMRDVPGISGRLFEGLGQNGVNVIAIAQGSSEHNISFVIETADEDKTLNLLHASFFDNVAKRYHLYVSGVGLIGSELLRQLEVQRAKLKAEDGVDIRVVAVANSRKIYADPMGIDLDPDKYMRLLDNSIAVSTASQMLELIDTHNLPNSIFVDNTASEEVAGLYQALLDSNVSIVTPNKVAASGSQERYNSLVSTAKRRNIDYLYETNVGAGLPIISTIRSMVDSGDEITSIEGVLSGSLSYIFNSYDVGMGFGELVSRAKELGFTEPDPRDDLSMSDVCRKIVILSRVAGMTIEMDDVVIDSVLPDGLPIDGSVANFIGALSKKDEYFGGLAKGAADEDGKLRVIASSTRQGASISLKVVGVDSPFYNLSGSDNMIVLKTKRYHQNPLVVKGPGAGAAVTAAGVFSDIISIAKRR
jgi:aspartokinase/homoserine dehydrogenase 1